MLLQNPSREKGWEMGHHILNPLSKRQGVSATTEKAESSAQPIVWLRRPRVSRERESQPLKGPIVWGRKQV
jgi:hypothetical protein